LKGLLMGAHGVKDFQIVGPGWIGDERFTIDATMPPDTTGDQTRAMLRNLLADRFKVQVHRESRSLPTYSLGIVRNGLKIPNTPPPQAKEPANSALATDGFPPVPPELTGVMIFVINGQAKMTSQQATMREVASQLERLLGVPVVDETQLTAKFDFILTFSPEGLNGPGGRPIPTLTRDSAVGLESREPLRDIFTALQSEIGLKLEQKKGPVEVIVIDHAEKVPTGN
jgi:uncharacterized protein (TIGR03435 family)